MRDVTLYYSTEREAFEARCGGTYATGRTATEALDRLGEALAAERARERQRAAERADRAQTAAQTGATT